MNAPTWNSLNHRQRLAAFNMNQDNFEQSNLSMAEEWDNFLECFENGPEMDEMLTSLNHQADTMDPTAKEFDALLRCCANKKGA